MRLNKVILTAAAFLTAALLSLLMSAFISDALEQRTARHVKRALHGVGMDWVQVSSDGLIATLQGTAPTESLRFRAMTVAASVVSTPRVVDLMEVTPPSQITAPRFSLEFLRNDDGISVIGLVPASWEAESLIASARGLSLETSLTNMLETADFPAPERWEEVTDFGLVALKLLPRSKISVAVDEVKVTAISDSPAQKRRFETELARSTPKGIPVVIEISAPRPVITPFTLRFLKDTMGPRFDACAADTERSRSRIAAAAQTAGMTNPPACTLGLGTPSPRWGEAAAAAILAVNELGSAVVTISDVDVTLFANPEVSQSDFDRVVGELTSKLPDVFSLKASLLTPPTPESGSLAQFTATLSADQKVQLRGRITNEDMRHVVEAYAHARFGTDNVYVATRLDDGLPPSWNMRVLSGLSALAELHNGSLLVQPERVVLRGVTGNQGATAEISRQLSERLGQGAEFSVDVTYDEKFDPLRGLPTPEECLANAKAVLDKRQLAFAPGKAEITGETIGVITALVEALTDCRELPMEIGGHTDSQGRAESNLRLSQERAEAVLQALDTRGADTSEMSATGYGAAEPIADNKTEAGRLANRRIELKLIQPTPPRSVEEVVAEAMAIQDAAQEAEFPDEPEGLEPMGEAGDLIFEDEVEAINTSETDPQPETAAVGEAETVAAPQTEVEAAPESTPEGTIEGAPAGEATPSTAPSTAPSEAEAETAPQPDATPADSVWQPMPQGPQTRPQPAPEERRQ